VEAVIQTHALTKRYGARAAVAGLDVSVPRGCVFGILGPNGAGKTTAIHMLLGLVRPTSGSAQVLGHRPGHRDALARIGFQPEHVSLYPFLSASEYLRTMGVLSGVARSELSGRIFDTLRLAGLGDRAGDRIRTFSHGMRQRLGIAQALLHAPELIILDEPTTGLDPIGLRDVRSLILHLKAQGTTVLLNSHLLSEVEQTCDEVAILKDGRVVRAGTLASLVGEGTAIDVEVVELTDAAMAALQRIAKRFRMQGMPPRRLTAWVERPEDAAEVAAALVGNGVRLLALTPRRESLEELFVRVVEGDG
jgi:ABC-2 type transport system ATP-binding protein